MITLNTIDSSVHSIQIIDAAGHAWDIDSDGRGFVALKDSDGDEIDINPDGSLTVTGTVNTAPAGYDTWATRSGSVSATAAQLDATPLSNRLAVEIQNDGSNDMAIGPANTVTFSGTAATDGLLVPKKTSQAIELDDAAAIYGICDTAKTTTYRLAEYAA